MEQDEMTQAEFIAYLETLAQLIEAKANSKEEAVQIVRDLMDRLDKAK